MFLSTTLASNIIAICSTFCAICAISVSVWGINTSKKIAASSIKANILFFVEKNPNTRNFDCVIKNFGSSIGLFMDLYIVPELDYEKSDYRKANEDPTFSANENYELTYITDYKNIYLAPNQKIRTEFPFKNYPDKKFDIILRYRSLDSYSTDNVYNINYSLDISCFETCIYIIK